MGLPLVAVIGIFFCIYMVHVGARKPPVVPIYFPPPVSPYEHFIAGEGIIESAFKNIEVAVPFQEIVSDVYVAVGALVKKGDQLFKLDTRHLEAQLVASMQDLKRAEIDYENQKTQFSFYERLKDKSAVSELAYKTAFYAQELAQQQIDIVKGQIGIIKADIERSKICAPIDGEVLQVNVRIGQAAVLNPFDKLSQILFGDTTTYHLRVDIDENNAWRYSKGSPATAFLRGNSKISIPLEFVYIEPYMIPKKSLTAADTEQVDTRVLQAVYQFKKNDYPVFAGQVLDIYIRSEPHGGAQ
jgi:multidrug efflux pump subunit AcrA (membrane-fusion protein)